MSQIWNKIRKNQGGLKEVEEIPNFQIQENLKNNSKEFKRTQVESIRNQSEFQMHSK